MPDTVFNVFDDAAFSVATLNDKVVRKVDYKPELLGALNIFEPIYSRSRTIIVANSDHALSLIPTFETGAPPVELLPEKSKIRPFQTTRLAKGSTITAESLQGILSMPFGMQVKEVQKEVADRTARIKTDMELTWEHMRLGAVLGKVIDADGTTVLNDWYAEWGIAEPSTVFFDLGNTNSDIRTKIRNMKRTMMGAAKGVWTTRTRVVALCGDAFYDALVAHKQYVETRLNNNRTAELEDIEGYDAVVYEGVRWINYRGTDDGTTMAIPTNEARFFPVGARGAFQVGWAPAEFFPTSTSRGATSTS